MLFKSRSIGNDCWLHKNNKRWLVYSVWYFIYIAIVINGNRILSLINNWHSMKDDQVQISRESESNAESEPGSDVWNNKTIAL